MAPTAVSGGAAGATSTPVAEAVAIFGHLPPPSAWSASDLQRGTRVDLPRRRDRWSRDPRAFRLGTDADHTEEEDMSDRQSRTYTGIGARRTPADVLDVMRSLAARLLRGGWILRSGGADRGRPGIRSGRGERRCRMGDLPRRRWLVRAGRSHPRRPDRGGLRAGRQGPPGLGALLGSGPGTPRAELSRDPRPRSQRAGALHRLLDPGRVARRGEPGGGRHRPGTAGRGAPLDSCLQPPAPRSPDPHRALPVAVPRCRGHRGSKRPGPGLVGETTKRRPTTVG